MLKFGSQTKVPKLFANSFLFCAFQSQSKNYIIVDANCPMFLQFSQQTLVSISKIFETLYQPLTKPCSHKAPCQALISSSCPHHLLLVFWELILGYVTPSDWYPNFLMVRLYLKCSLV